MNKVTNKPLPKKCVFGVFRKDGYDGTSEEERRHIMTDTVKRVLESDIAHNDKKTYDVTVCFPVLDYVYNEVGRVVMKTLCRREHKVIQVEVCQA